MFLFPRRRVRQNTYYNTYVEWRRLAHPVPLKAKRMSQRAIRQAWADFQKIVTDSPYHFWTVLEKDHFGADTPQYRGNAVPRDLARTYDFLRNLRMKLQDTKALYSVAEAADLLSLSRGTVYKLVQSGRLVAVYPTSKARISRSALNRFVDQLERESREAASVIWEAFQ